MKCFPNSLKIQNRAIGCLNQITSKSQMRPQVSVRNYCTRSNTLKIQIYEELFLKVLINFWYFFATQFCLAHPLMKFHLIGYIMDRLKSHIQQNSFWTTLKSILASPSAIRFCCYMLWFHCIKLHKNWLIRTVQNLMVLEDWQSLLFATDDKEAMSRKRRGNFWTKNCFQEATAHIPACI